MSELEKQTQQDREDDRDIRALMRETDYSGRLRDEFKRDLLREINHNFRYHRLRSRILPVAVVVLLGISAAWWTTDVGSDGFNLLPTGRAVDGVPVVEAPMTHTRFNVPTVDGDERHSLRATEGVYDQIASGDAKVLRLEIRQIGNDVVQCVWLEVLHNGEPTEVMRTIGDSARFSRQWSDFQSGPARELVEAIRRDAVTPQRIERVTIGGREFAMGIWTWNTKEYGQVIYRRSLR